MNADDERDYDEENYNRGLMAERDDDVTAYVTTTDPHPPTELWHADDCGGSAFCGGCGYIAADGAWYPGPCPDADRAFQSERSEGPR